MGGGAGMSRMADCAGNMLAPIELGDDQYDRYRVEVTDDGHADIIWREELRFHRERCDADAESFGDRNSNYRPWSTYTEENGGSRWLTTENAEKLVAELRRLTKVDDIDTTEDGDADNWDDANDGYVAFSIRTDYREGETVSEWFDRIGWPVIAELVNCTDPGTFNHPYLFSAMLYH